MQPALSLPLLQVAGRGGDGLELRARLGLLARAIEGDAAMVRGDLTVALIVAGLSILGRIAVWLGGGR